ncbi:MAG: PDZ domain-containing protein [Planctomycetes bacterium]|nr:PDZ domain-containing protein [Planctomycetota bacterium]
MKSNYRLLFIVAFFGVMILSDPSEAVAAGKAKNSKPDFEDRIKKSIVHLTVTANSYENLQPWKRSTVRKKSGYGCAVAPYQILTTAWNVSNATFIKVKIAGQNEFVPATVKVIDYESNLCLLDLDRDSMSEGLTPLTFSEDFDEDEKAASYRLTSGGHLKTGRGILDRAEVNISTMSFGYFLDYVVVNAPSSSGRASLYCVNEKPVGIANWAEIDNKETGLIPGIVINKFLKDAAKGEYKGFPSFGFSAKKLIDPATRKFLKMPDDLKDGVYVSKVFSLGTGSKELREGDCILSIDGNTLDPYGKFSDPVFEKILYHHLISGHTVGDKIKFVVWRDGKKVKFDVKAKTVNAADMLVDYHEYGLQPEYIITAGFVIQKLTRPYLKIWGDGWSGKVPPHLYHYYRDTAFNPTKDRQDIAVLSYVLPADINQGYHSLGRLVISKINGKVIKSFKDVPAALKAATMSRFNTIEFEHDYPTVVIERAKLEEANAFIAKTYRIQKLKNIRQ